MAIFQIKRLHMYKFKIKYGGAAFIFLCLEYLGDLDT